MNAPLPTMERTAVAQAAAPSPAATAAVPARIANQLPANLDIFDRPRSLGEAMEVCKFLAGSDMVPKDYQNKPANILVAWQWGAELGLKLMQSLQNIACINGRPSLWGDAMLALVRSSPWCEYVRETWLPDGTAEIRSKRRGDPYEHVRTFSDEDARLAGLKGKSGPWTQNPKRMKQLRARAFLLRDVYTDVLRGIPMTEEVMDYMMANPPAAPAAASAGTQQSAGQQQGFDLEEWKRKAAAAKTDEAAVAIYNEGLKVMAHDRNAASEFKRCVVARRNAIRDAQAGAIDTTSREVHEPTHQQPQDHPPQQQEHPQAAADNPPQDGDPATPKTGRVTYASVMDRMQNAVKKGDVDLLDVESDWIREVDDETQRQELTAKYGQLRAQLTK